MLIFSTTSGKWTPLQRRIAQCLGADFEDVPEDKPPPPLQVFDIANPGRHATLVQVDQRIRRIGEIYGLYVSSANGRWEVRAFPRFSKKKKNLMISPPTVAQKNSKKS